MRKLFNGKIIQKSKNDRKNVDSCFAFLFWLICCFTNQLNVNLFCFRLKPYDSESDESDDGLDYDDLPPLEIPESDHKLQYTYNLWFAKKGSHRASVC